MRQIHIFRHNVVPGLVLQVINDQIAQGLSDGERDAIAESVVEDVVRVMGDWFLDDVFTTEDEKDTCPLCGDAPERRNFCLDEWHDDECDEEVLK